MDAETLKSFLPEFTRFLGRFADCFCDHRCRGHLPVDIRGQLSNLDRKSVEPIAVASGVATRTLQEFLSLLSWDHERMLDRLQRIVAAEHGGRGSVGLLDETSFVKKGTKTPGVQRQWCGTLGKIDNCVVTVHLGYTRGDFQCLLDGDLFLPESWDDDRVRCRAAGIPESVVYRPKWRPDELLERHPQLRELPWTQYRLDDRRKGPSVWEVKHVRFHPESDDGLPGEAEHLLVARHALQDADVKYFRSNAPEGTPTATLLRVALTRHRVERCFQDRKSELGLDHYEGRTYTGLMRHLDLTLVSYPFAMRAVETRRGEKPGVDGAASASGGRRAGGGEVAERTRVAEGVGATGRRGDVSPSEKPTGPEIPREADAAAVAGTRHSIDSDGTVPTAELAL